MANKLLGETLIELQPEKHTVIDDRVPVIFSKNYSRSIAIGKLQCRLGAERAFQQHAASYPVLA